MKGYTTCGKLSAFCGLLSIILLIPGRLWSQPDWNWVQRAGTTNDQQAYAIVSDSLGNSYVTGSIRGLLNLFGLNSVSSNGMNDIFLAKYDAAGNNIWVKHAGGSDDERGRGIALDANGNIYICGDFENNVTFYGSPNVQLNGSGNPSTFVAKYDPNGNVLWAKRGASNNGLANSITTDGVNVFVTGGFSGSITFGALPTLNSSGGQDAFLACYNASNGAEQWAIRGGGSGADEGESVSMDVTGVYVAGYFSNTASFQNSPGSLSSDGGTDVFLAKYNFTGSGIWKRKIGSAGNDEGESVRCYGTHVYIGGYYTSSLNIYNTGPAVATISNIAGTDAFLVRYNCISGNYEWSSSESGPGNERIYAITTDPNGNLLATGYFTGTMSFGGNPPLTATNDDAFVTSRDSNGIFMYVACSSGNGDETAMGIASPANGAIFIAGYFSAVATFGTNSVTSLGSDDIFTAHLGCLVSVAYAGADQNICSGPALMNGNTPLIGTGLWSFAQGSGTMLNPSSPGATILNPATGQNILVWTVSNGACSSSDSVEVVVNAMPTTANAGNDQHICSSTTTLNGNTPLIGSGIWTVTLGQALILNPLAPTTAVSGLSPGVNQFRWAISNVTCPLSMDTVTIFVDDAPDSADAGSDLALCSDSVTLAGNDPAIGSGMWSLVSGNGTLINPDSADAGITNLSPGITVLQWTISNGVCPSSSDQVQITVDAEPTPASAGTDQEICSQNTTLSGNTPTTGSGYWTLLSGTGTIASPGSSASAVNGITAPVSIFQWQITNGVCPSSSDSVTILLDSLPTIAVATADHSICSGADTLAANTPIVGSGSWSLLSGSGIIEDQNSSQTPVSVLGPGQNIFAWTISNGVCPSSSDQLIITVDAFPSVASAGNDRNTCTSSDSLHGNLPVTGTGTWSLINGSALIGNTGSAQTPVTGLVTGTNLFEWKITNGTCPSSADTVAITYNEPPSAPVAGPDILACSHYVIMQAQTPLVGDGVWDPLPGSFPFADTTNPNAALPYLPDGTWYYTWTTQNGFCTSAADTVAVFIYSSPSVADAGQDQLIHVTAATLEANSPDTGIGTWSIVQGSGIFENIHDPHSRIDNLLPGITIARWTTSNGVCNSYEDDVRIEVRTLIVPTGYSPNGDGVNDYFEIIGLDEYNAPRLEVYNRWGNVVYASPVYTNEWNGTQVNGEPLPDDVYYYILNADEQTTFTGYVIIKRTAP